jgi:hypothetical protein
LFFFNLILLFVAILDWQLYHIFFYSCYL